MADEESKRAASTVPSVVPSLTQSFSAPDGSNAKKEIVRPEAA
jgi:hypothetical protein